MKNWHRVLNKNDKYSRHFLKLVSLFFACFLWFYVLNSEPQVVEQLLTLSLKSPKGLSVSNIVPAKIKVKLKGSRAFVRNVVEREEKIYLNLKNYPYKKKGGFNVLLTPNDVSVPFGVEVISVSPDNFKVKLEKRITKKLTIKASLVGSLPTDLNLIKKTLEPATVLVSGPIEVMRKISKVVTSPIDITNLQGKGELKISLGQMDSRVESNRASAITFKYIVKPRKANLTLKKVKIRFLTTSTRLKSKSKYVSLDVLAPEGVRITASSVQVIADVPDKKGVHRVKLRAKLPEGIHLLQINPQSINVTIR
ncbi:hypothetical protein A9Q84_02895 [Halobacteriovorax marinus]|uniref:YbbR-like protein n=1 Tax=Halobacteriovorax marinus TaxID=97084 RepID=A0A1Y5FGU8_9BACT|nr:hypothetical protein A9Q84_02895 [Halobacteriovorax marinus]